MKPLSVFNLHGNAAISDWYCIYSCSLHNVNVHILTLCIPARAARNCKSSLWNGIIILLTNEGEMVILPHEMMATLPYQILRQPDWCLLASSVHTVSVLFLVNIYNNTKSNFIILWYYGVSEVIMKCSQKFHENQPR